MKAQRQLFRITRSLSFSVPQKSLVFFLPKDIMTFQNQVSEIEMRSSLFFLQSLFKLSLKVKSLA